MTYTSNSVNQYTGVATGGGRFILGEAPAANAVTVNGDAAARAGGLGFYWKQITGSNTSAPLWSNDSVVSNGTTIAGKIWTPKGSVTPTYNADGDLTNDGRWKYSWDAENRLTRMETTDSATTAGVPRQQVDFVYDLQGRRVSKTLSTWNGTAYDFTSNRRFLYDGWNLIVEYSALSATSTTLTLQATHTWGIDLSGRFQGAGGVGGLLATHLITSPAAACYPAYDGNGNISAWIDDTGTLLGRMDYSPFGQLIAQYKFTSAGDTKLARLAFGFSTKYSDAESGLLYYGYRYYDPVNGRWPSRDPIQERGGINLYGFVGNDGINGGDFLGLTDCSGIVSAGHGGLEPGKGRGNDNLYNGKRFNRYQDGFFDGNMPPTTVFVGCGANYFNDVANAQGWGINNPPRNDSSSFFDNLRKNATDPNQLPDFRKESKSELEKRVERTNNGGTDLNDLLLGDDDNNIPDTSIETAVDALVAEKCRNECCKTITVTIKQDGKPDRKVTKSCR